MTANDGGNQAIWPTGVRQGGSVAGQPPGGSVAPAGDASSDSSVEGTPAVQPDPFAPPFTVASPYPPIADYAFLSDCEVTALVAPSSAIEWMCLPRLDSPSVFGAILDRDAGRFKFGPENISEPADRRYLPGTMVVETSWDCGDGWIVVRDCLLMGPWRRDKKKIKKSEIRNRKLEKEK